MTLDGDVVGTLDGHPVREIVIDEYGRRYRFAGLAPRHHGGRYDVFALREGEWIVEPGLIYRIEPDSATGNNTGSTF